MIVPSHKLKDYILSEVAKEQEVPLEVVEKIIKFEGEEVLRALKTCHEVELSGLGKFMISQSKLKRRIDKMIRVRDSLIRKLVWGDKPGTKQIADKQRRLEAVLADIAEMKSKLKDDHAN